MDRILFFSYKHPWKTALLLILVTLFFGYGLTKVKIDLRMNTLFNKSSALYKQTEKIKQDFNLNSESAIYLQSNQLFTPELLAQLEALHYAIDELPFVTKTESLFSIGALRNEDGAIDSGPVLQEAPYDIDRAHRARATMLFDPYFPRSLISETADATLITFESPEKHWEGKTEQVDKALKKAMAQHANLFDKTFYMGSIRVYEDVRLNQKHDMHYLIPSTLLAIIVMIFLFFRYKLAAFLPIVTGTLSLIWTFGFMGYAHIPINLLCTMLPILIIAIGATEDIHLFSAYMQGTQLDVNKVRDDYIRYMLRVAGVATILTSITTCLGFFGNVFSSIQMIKDFGYASGMAMLLNAIITLITLPMLFKWFGARGKTKLKTPDMLFLKKIFETLHVKHAKKMLWVFALLSLVFLVIAYYRLHINLNIMEYFLPKQAFVSDTKLFEKQFVGNNTFYISVQSKNKNAFLTPANLVILDKLDQAVSASQLKPHVMSFSDQLKLMNQVMHDGNKQYFTIPKTKKLIEQYLLFVPPELRDKYVTHDYKHAIIVVKHGVSSSYKFKQIMQPLFKKLKTIAGPSLKISLAGRSVLLDQAMEDLILGQLQGLVFILFIVFLLFSLMYQNIRAGIIALIPNIFPLIMVAGIMGIFSISLNHVTSLIAVISIGVVVDDTIHLFSKYNKTFRQTGDVNIALVDTVRQETAPVVISSLSLMVGFLVLKFSLFATLGQFGILSAIAMLLAVASDLLLSPLLISRVRIVNILDVMLLKLDQAVLFGSQLFQNIKPRHIKKLILLCQTKVYANNELIIKQNSEDTNMYLILKGQVEVFKETEGKKQSLAILKPGEYFGEMAYLTKIKRTASVRTLEATELMVFNEKSLVRNTRSYPKLMLKMTDNINRILGERLVELSQHGEAV